MGSVQAWGDRRGERETWEVAQAELPEEDSGEKESLGMAPSIQL